MFRRTSVFFHCTRNLHIDLRRVRDNAEYKIRNAKQRAVTVDVPLIVGLYEKVTSLSNDVSRLRSERNARAADRSKGYESQHEGRRLKDRIADVEAQLAESQRQLDDAALQLPCDSHPSAPIGDESAARLVMTHGTRPSFSFTPRSHEEVGKALGLFDMDAGRSIAGSGFVVLSGDGVLLESALVQWALAMARQAGFQVIAPPDVALTEIVQGCGFNPRQSGGAASQVYSIADSTLSLVGTSEISLAGLHRGSILDLSRLPALYCAVSHCFRREAGGGGTRDRGLYRLHQFTKVELFAYVSPHDPAAATEIASDATAGPLPPSKQADALLDSLVRLQMRMYADLGLHFRVLDMPTEELGAAAYRKFDIEAWMPCRVAKADGVSATGSPASSSAAPLLGAFGEISSASSCADYQARRLGIRYRHGPKDNRFVHTINATACAVPRVMLALLETHQQADGSVRVPLCLQPYLGGMTELRPKEPTHKLPQSLLYDLPERVVLS
jgi:seryl-tRNA synthetase